MTIHYSDERVTIHHAHALRMLRSLPDASVDAILTDPPYGLTDTTPKKVAIALYKWVHGNRAYTPSGDGFMKEGWDSFVPPPAVWDECLRVLKPGGHALVFAGSRTFDLMGMSMRLAGFDVRDSIAWLTAQGMPKSLNVAQAIDKAAGQGPASRGGFTVAGRTKANLPNPDVQGYQAHEPVTEEAKRWDGWGTGLRPSNEPILVARKGLRGTVVDNVLAHGTGALNIDGTRIGDEVRINPPGSTNPRVAMGGYWRDDAQPQEATGRWPANVVLDEGVASDLEEASKFYYCAKAPKSERPVVGGTQHATVKPLTLIRYLARLITQPDGLVCDPFLGSGTTAEACILEGLRFVGGEREESYLPLISTRIQRQG